MRFKKSYNTELHGGYTEFHGEYFVMDEVIDSVIPLLRRGNEGEA